MDKKLEKLADQMINLTPEEEKREGRRRRSLIQEWLHNKDY
jgi:hypothetical protein